MFRRSVSTALLTGLLVLSGMAGASADGGVSLSSNDVSLTATDAATASGTLTFVNTVDGEVGLTATLAMPRNGCSPALDTTALPQQHQTDVKVTLSGCHLRAGDDVKVVVAAASVGAKWEVSASLGGGHQPWYRLLVCTLIGLGLGIATLLAVYLQWDGETGTRALTAARLARSGDKVRPRLTEPLFGLTSNYDLTKSWASNVTVLSTVFAGVFGTSGVVKALLGEDPDSKLAVVTVSAAVATSLVVLAPLVLLALRKGYQTPTQDGTSTGEGDDTSSRVARQNPSFTPMAAQYPTAGGLLLAAALTLTAVTMQVGVLIWTALGMFTSGFSRFALVSAALLAAIVLFQYGRSSLLEALTVGRTQPKPVTDNVTRAERRSVRGPDGDETVVVIQQSPGRGPAALL